MREVKMRKFGFILLIVILVFTLIACENKEKIIAKTKIISPIVTDNLKPVQSFGNQQNQRYSSKGSWMELVQHDEWIYYIDKSFSEKGILIEASIVKFPLDNPQKREIIYKSEWLSQINIFGEWVFFLEDFEQGNFSKIKKDGSEKTKLASNVNSYVLTEEEAYYETKFNELKICAIHLDGSHKRDVLENGHSLVGIENGWVYYNKFDKNNCIVEYPGPRRIKIDGTGSESVLDSGLKALEPFTVENNKLFYTRWDGNIASIIMKTIGNDEETVLISFSPYSYIEGEPSGEPVNQEGDWIFFYIENTVYKININGKEEKELVYKASNNRLISSILLYEKDVLICTSEGDGVYIKDDGTIIEFEL